MMSRFQSFTVFLLLFVTLLPVRLVIAQEYKFKADLDSFINLPGAYKLTPDDLDKMFEKGSLSMNPYFEWLTKDRSRAIFKRKPAGNVLVDMTIVGGEVPVQEMIVDFKDGLYLGTTISIFNRGDAGSMSVEEFNKSFMAVGKHLGKQLAARPNRRQGNIKRGVLTSGYTWISARGMAVLEYNPGVKSQNQKVEFLRMRLCRRDAKGSYAAAMQERAAASVRQSELPRNVKKDGEGNVYVSNIPMVDQGGKGYCVVASVQRLFEYYGVPCDMHQLADIADADPERGTSSVNTNKELGAIDHLFKMRYACLAVSHNRRLVEPIEENGKLYIKNGAKSWDLKDFQKVIRKYANLGVPLLWSLQLGPEFKEDPPLSEQTSGGHMRLIIGYNDDTERILFSDSWGAGHELKSMAMEDAIRATSALFLMKPVTN